MKVKMFVVLVLVLAVVSLLGCQSPCPDASPDCDACREEPIDDEIANENDPDHADHDLPPLTSPADAFEIDSRIV